MLENGDDPATTTTWLKHVTNDENEGTAFRPHSRTSNLGFARWGDVFGDQVVASAMIDPSSTIRSSSSSRARVAGSGTITPRDGSTFDCH